MRPLLGFIAALSLVPPAAGQSRQIKHAILIVAATDDEWTATGVAVHPGDLMIVRAPGYITIGAITGDVDANGAHRGSSGNGVNGSLEFKIGVGAAKPAGKFNLHEVEESGDLKLRVRDSDYRDNHGQFEVDVVVIPPSAIPPATNAMVPTPTREEADSIFMIATRGFLRQLVTAEEQYFSDHTAYTNRLDELTIQVPAGVALRALSIRPDGHVGGWTAIATHARLRNTECAIAVNALNPVNASAGDGEPVCREAP